ncbi:hypothetical protein U1Q18_003421 [Sarracenia purpurea var. burkii]
MKKKKSLTRRRLLFIPGSCNSSGVFAPRISRFWFGDLSGRIKFLVLWFRHRDLVFFGPFGSLLMRRLWFGFLWSCSLVPTSPRISNLWFNDFFGRVNPGLRLSGFDSGSSTLV